MTATETAGPAGTENSLLHRTPDQILGPFYPVHRTPDPSGDLTKGGRAERLVLHLSGTIRRLDGTPIPAPRCRSGRPTATAAIAMTATRIRHRWTRISTASRQPPPMPPGATPSPRSSRVDFNITLATG